MATLLLAACSSKPDTPSLRIIQFGASPNTVTRGGQVTLAYKFENGTGRITTGDGGVVASALPSEGTKAISPSATTSYILTVEAPGAQPLIASVTVVVLPPPQITRFDATPSTVAPGSAATLSFVFADGKGSVDQGVGAVTSGVAKVVHPTTTTTYTLTVTNDAGAQVSETRVVTVGDAPLIASFGATPSIVSRGGSAVLAWTFSNGSGQIAPNIGAVQPQGSRNITNLSVTTTYTLTVTNAVGTVSREFTITVVPLPTIAQFTATPDTLTRGCPQGAMLSFDFDAGPNGTGMISQGVGSVTSPGSRTVNPTNTTRYTLTVTNAANDSITRDVTVTRVLSLTASRSMFYVNQGTDLTAVFGTGDTGVIQPGELPVQSGVPLTVRPSLPTRYVLTVTCGGSSVSTSVTVYPGTCVAAGTAHSLALRSSDGTVWAWGWNAYGQLGDGTNTTRSNPQQVPGLSGIISIAAGADHSLALHLNGTIYAWGKNESGQLGVGNTYESRSPVQVTGLRSRPIALGAGDGMSRALMSDGTVETWGRNDYGQLGLGDITNRSTPYRMLNLNTVVAIGGGEFHTLALLSDGQVWSCGWNVRGQLGNGGTSNLAVPGPVTGLQSVVAIAPGGEAHSMALLASGAVVAWGINNLGQLGDGTTADRHTPVQVSSLFGGVAGIWAGDNHSLAYRKDIATNVGWGRNNYGQIGSGGTSTAPTTAPRVISGGPEFVAMAGGWYHSLGVRARFSLNGGTVWAWGKNDLSQLGDGTQINRYSPVQVQSLVLW